MLLAVLLGRTLWLSPEPFDAGPAPDLPVVDADAAAQRLARAVRIATISPHPDHPERTEAMLALHAQLRADFPRVHQALSPEVVNELSLLFRWPGSDPSLQPILLIAHMDVVPVEPGTEGEWTHPPFSGHIADGVVWGRGTMDDKTGVVGLLSAAELLLEQGFVPARTVVFAFGHDEEIGGDNGAIALAATLEQRGERFAYVLDEGGAVVSEVIPGLDHEVAMVGVAEKGYASIELSLRDEGGHASMPPPTGAIGRLATAITRIEAEPMPKEIRGGTQMMLDGIAPHTNFGMRIALANQWLVRPVLASVLSARPPSNATVRTTLAPTIFAGGVASNVLASRADAVVNARILSGDTVQDVLAHVREVIDDPGIEVRCGDDCWEPSPVSDAQGEGFTVVRRAITHVFRDAITVPYLVVGATDARHYAKVARNAYRFLPIRMRGDDRKRMHGTDEQMTVENFADAVRFYAAVITLGAG